jgi:hypothetical protein
MKQQFISSPAQWNKTRISPTLGSEYSIFNVRWVVCRHNDCQRLSQLSEVSVPLGRAA